MYVVVPSSPFITWIPEAVIPKSVSIDVKLTVPLFLNSKGIASFDITTIFVFAFVVISLKEEPCTPIAFPLKTTVLPCKSIFPLFPL